MKDRMQVYYVKSRKAWRFRMVKDGEIVFVSNGEYVDAVEAKRVAEKLNRECFAKGYTVSILAASKL